MRLDIAEALADSNLNVRQRTFQATYSKTTDAIEYTHQKHLLDAVATLAMNLAVEEESEYPMYSFTVTEFLKEIRNLRYAEDGDDTVAY